MKTLDFFLRPFDQTLRFQISTFSVLGILCQNENSRVEKTQEFDQNALRPVYIEQSDFHQSIIIKGEFWAQYKLGSNERA